MEPITAYLICTTHKHKYEPDKSYYIFGIYSESNISIISNGKDWFVSTITIGKYSAPTFEEAYNHLARNIKNDIKLINNNGRILTIEPHKNLYV
jgi:hypothetical protein